MIRKIRPLPAALLLLAHATANPFFAMDTGIRGTPEAVATTLHELGYDGLGASGTDIKPTLAALESRNLRLQNVYLTLAIHPGEPALTPAIRQLVADLRGHDSALWLAISQGPPDDTALATALREIAVVADGAGVAVSIYPHTGFRVSRFSQAAELAAAIDLPNTGITFNLCHWLKVEGDADPLPAIIREKSRLQFVTINGADRGDTRAMGWDRLIQPLGRGSYDVPGFLRRLRDQAGRTGPIGLQSYGIPGDSRANLAASLAAWRRMTESLDGMVLCGYQGWFRCPGDGADVGWRHYSAGGKFGPDSTQIEMWPDMSELAPDERFPTPLRNPDGSAAEIFSSAHPATVRRHFRWMREYGIDGAFVQRFATDLRDPRTRAAADLVLAHCRAAAAAEGRKWALMYDLSGLQPAEFPSIIEDWRRLKTDDSAGLRLAGKPLVALWGIGFSDHPAALAEWRDLIRQLKSDGRAVMLGVPYHWRTLDQDCVPDPALHEILAMADVISPWSVGRIATPEDAASRVKSVLQPDLDWCRARGISYLPVVFPGFSWSNLQRSRGRKSPINQIPRLGGKFLQSQAAAIKSAGATAVYIAMFDEIDEGTAIFKTSPTPPAGGPPFLAEPGIPPDHYLRLAGEIGEMLRGAR